MLGLVEKYAWADDPSLDVVWCISVITGMDKADVIRIFGGNPDAGQPLSFTEAEAEVVERSQRFGEFFLAQVFSTDRHVVVLENNGYSGTLPEIARRASANGHYLSMCRSLTGHRVIEAKDGTVTAHFEAMLGQPAYRLDDRQSAWIEGIALTEDRFWATLLALMEQQTGLAFEQTWLEDKLPTYRLPDPDALYQDVPNARVP